MIRMDLLKLDPTPETIGGIFGFRHVDCIRITAKDGVKLVKDGASPSWPVQAGRGYNLVYEGSDITPCSIRDIYSFLGGNEEQIHNLSLAFYKRIWTDTSNPDFRSHFTSSVKTPEEAADNQARWLIEMWGGPPLYAEKHGGDLVGRRMLSRHASPTRMTFHHACTWLDYMNAAVSEVYGDNKQVKLVFGLYWRHFFGFFSFTDEERIGIRKKALNDTS
jgi:truncated hemoglobin YjbI